MIFKISLDNDFQNQAETFYYKTGERYYMFWLGS